MNSLSFSLSLSLSLSFSFLALACAADVAEDTNCGDSCDEVSEADECPWTPGVEYLGVLHDSEEVSVSDDFYQLPRHGDLWSFDVVDDLDGQNPKVRIEVTANEGASFERIARIRTAVLCDGAVIECISGRRSSSGLGCGYDVGAGGSRVLEFSIDCNGFDDSAQVSVRVDSAYEDLFGADFEYVCMSFGLDVLVY